MVVVTVWATSRLSLAPVDVVVEVPVEPEEVVSDVDNDVL